MKCCNSLAEKLLFLSFLLLVLVGFCKQADAGDFYLEGGLGVRNYKVLHYETKTHYDIIENQYSAYKTEWFTTEYITIGSITLGYQHQFNPNWSASVRLTHDSDINSSQDWGSNEAVGSIRYTFMR